MEERFKVDFIGIGTIKAGTTWLANCLRTHPEICLSEPKGINYFNLYKDYVDANTPVYNNNHGKPLSWYINHFRHCQSNRIKGEFSTLYLYDEKAPSKIKSQFPQVKLLACLRNPIDRAYSHFWMHKGYSALEMTFEEAIEKKQIYIEMGLYSKQLKRYLHHFRRDQILIILFDDLVNRPVQEFNKVLRFLDVSTHVNFDSLNKSYSNPAQIIRSKRMEDFVHHASRVLINIRFSYILNILRKAGLYHLFTKLNRLPFEYPRMNPETRKYLRHFYEDEIIELEKLLGMDLSHWD